MLFPSVKTSMSQLVISKNHTINPNNFYNSTSIRLLELYWKQYSKPWKIHVQYYDQLLNDVKWLLVSEIRILQLLESEMPCKQLKTDH